MFVLRYFAFLYGISENSLTATKLKPPKNSFAVYGKIFVQVIAER
jgi:hypothetical protein